MTKKDLELSPRYGVNAAIPRCFYCMQDKDHVIFVGRMRTAESDDAEAPRDAYWDKVPCDQCKTLMAVGVMLVGADETLSDDLKNPYRTGNMVVVTEEAFRMMFRDHRAIETRVTFIPHSVWLRLGLPTSAEEAEALMPEPELVTAVRVSTLETRARKPD